MDCKKNLKTLCIDLCLYYKICTLNVFTFNACILFHALYSLYLKCSYLKACILKSCTLNYQVGTVKRSNLK
jgi:hypothetical protein